MNELRTWDPFSLDPLDDSLRTLIRPWLFEPPEIAPRIRIDLAASDGQYAVTAKIPGVRKEDIDVHVDGNLVTISAALMAAKEDRLSGRVLRHERQQGGASRSFALACPVDESRPEATYRNGVLELKLPKRAASARRRLAIQ